MATMLDISPTARASVSRFLYRQLVLTPPPLNREHVNLGGKTAVVTGANSGIGLETVRLLLDLGCEVILAVRDERKGQEARQVLLGGDTGDPSNIAAAVRVWSLDLADYDSIMAFAERCKRDLERLDIVILNAGLYKVAESFHPTTGFEESVQINYLSNALLALLLLPILKTSRNKKTTAEGKSAICKPSPGRICMVSSDVASWARFEERASNPLLRAFQRQDDDDMESPRYFDSSDRYGTTKLLGQLFLTELAKRVDRRM
ncbi:hypothetical protein ONZ43_g5507 [Nemania bipapillata]|uniref:Uncharacterized protein n=1 Tax=Nemania bipapillata TaxID=110536 RepID=A0ACC2I9V4_9PEZI|nr:hypothetical protein ONZ43_g5507 [Nemania bipapillata]